MTRVRPGPAAALAAATAAAILLRCWHIAGWPLWLDESWSRWMTEQSWSGLWTSAVRYDTHPPVYYALLKAWAGLAPSTPAGLRLLSVLAGLAMLPLAWATAGEMEALRRSVWPRIVAVALAAISPPLVIAARQARPYALFALAFALALWAALRLVREGDSSRRARASLWLLYLAALEATLWLHSLGALFAAALGGGLFLAMAVEGSLRRRLLPFATVHAVAALAWLPGLLILLEQRRSWSASSWLRFSLADLPAGLASGLVVGGAAALFILVFAGAGAWTLLRDRSDRPAAILLLCAALLPAAAAILVSLVASPVFLPRTLVPSVLPLLLLAAAGIATIRGAPSFYPGLFAAAAIIVLLPSAVGHVTSEPEERWSALASSVERRAGGREEIWLLPNEIALPFRYGRGGGRVAARGIPAGFPAPNHVGPRPSGTRAVPGVTREDADRLVADARARGLTGIWLVSRFAPWFDPAGALPEAFGPGSRDVRDLRFAPLVVEHYRLAPASGRSTAVQTPRNSVTADGKLVPPHGSKEQP